VAENRYLPLTGGIALTTVYALMCLLLHCDHIAYTSYKHLNGPVFLAHPVYLLILITYSFRIFSDVALLRVQAEIDAASAGMNRKLNLSHLTDEECEQILKVVQRDFDIREQEKGRLS